MQSLQFTAQLTAQDAAIARSQKVHSLIYRGVPYEKFITVSQIMHDPRSLIYRGVAYSTPLVTPSKPRQQLMYRGTRYCLAA